MEVLYYSIDTIQTVREQFQQNSVCFMCVGRTHQVIQVTMSLTSSTTLLLGFEIIMMLGGWG